MHRLGSSDHGVLGTLHATRGIDLVPVVFAVDGEVVGVPIDEVKPKSSTNLQRTKNLADDPRATLLVEGWDHDDWTRLWWVRAELRRIQPDAAANESLDVQLREKYSQYQGTTFAGVLTFEIASLYGWSAT